MQKKKCIYARKSIKTNKNAIKEWHFKETQFMVHVI